MSADDEVKQSTRDAIKDKSLAYRQEMIRFLFSTMDAVEFSESFWDFKNECWNDDAEEIADAFGAELPEPEGDYIDVDTAERMHEAICEGRRDEAIDLLRECFTEYRLRPVSEQRNLFPDRIP